MKSLKLKIIGEPYQRLAISHKIIEYLNAQIEIIIVEQLSPKNKWNNVINLNFYTSTLDFELDYRVGRIYKEESIKVFWISMSLQWLKSQHNPVKSFIDCIIEGLMVYFSNNYKKVPLQLIEDFKEKIDFNYLETFPYPASFHEQKCDGDKEYWYPVDIYYWFDDIKPGQLTKNEESGLHFEVNNIFESINEKKEPFKKISFTIYLSSVFDSQLKINVGQNIVGKGEKIIFQNGYEEFNIVNRANQIEIHRELIPAKVK